MRFMAKLIILCGLPGSGKSQYAMNYKAVDDAICTGCTVLHSSDAIRAELFGEAGSQEDNAKVFELMHKRVKEDLRAGKTVIYDATNVTRKARRGAINLASAEDTIECHIIWADLDECIHRDALRARKVGPAVIDKMIRRWQSPWFDEGFDFVKVILNQDSFDQVKYVACTTSNMYIPHENPHHQLGVWEHCMQAYHNVAQALQSEKHMSKATRDAILAAAFWHDIGKPYTKFFKPGEEIAHYYDHHCVGGYLVYGLFLNNQLMCIEDKEIACFISWLVANHMEPFFDSKYFRQLDPELKRYIDLLHEADLSAH